MNQQIHNEAADFFVEFELNRGTQKDREALDAWLRKSPENIRAYLQILPAWEDSRYLPKIDFEQLVGAANAASNISSLPNFPTSVGGARVPRRTRRWLYVLASAAALAILAVGAVVTLPYIIAPTYSTRTGESLALQLTDGSVINLNTRSRIRVQFNDSERRIELIDGQALFQVAKDSHRPFIVTSDQAQIQVLGTSFDVHRKAAGTTVTVVEGKVAVREAGNSSLLTAGEQAIVTPAAITAPKRTNVANATAWAHRRLVFDAATLAEVVEEFNRYSDTRLILDSALRPLSITAKFDSTDPTSLVNFLGTLPDIQVHRNGRFIQITAKR